jgi:hypothetical protein
VEEIMLIGAFTPEFPYDAYQYGSSTFDVFLGRYTCNLFTAKIPGRPQRRLHISRARYILSTSLKRLLRKDEHVDHIDNDPINDRLENLQVLTSAENLAKQAALLSVKKVFIICPACGTVFIRVHGNTALVSCKKGTIHCCSRRCSGKLSNMHLLEEQRMWLQQVQILFVAKEYNDGRVFMEWSNPNVEMVNGNISFRTNIR